MKNRFPIEPPSKTEQSQSRALAEIIRSEIRAEGGWISFERYMQLALYSPSLGYYAAHRRIFGEGGDYVTAPGLGGLFAACIAGQVAEVLSNPATRGNNGERWREIVEFGAGTADLAAGVLMELDRLNALPDRYSILETGTALRARQQKRLSVLPARLRRCVHWLEEIPSGIHGVVLANEVLDAIPFHRFHVQPEGEVAALGVACSGDRFHWAAGPTPPDLLAAIRPMDLPCDYRSEWNRQAPAWVTTVAERLRSGIMILVDYGYDRRTYYHADRSMGTMRCHYRHLAHEDPFHWPGLQDITAHVEFTGICEAARSAGLSLLGYADQAQFLIGAGFARIYAERFEEAGAGSTDAMALASEARRLTMPSGMGEQFKCIAFGRQAGELSAFAGCDQSHRLAA